jgi:hypothetical protein
VDEGRNRRSVFFSLSFFVLNLVHTRIYESFSAGRTTIVRKLDMPALTHMHFAVWILSPSVRSFPCSFSKRTRGSRFVPFRPARLARQKWRRDVEL